MRKIRNYRVKRPIAALLAALCLVLWQAPPAAAFYKQRSGVRLKNGRTSTPDAELREKIQAKEAAEREQPDVQELSAAQMGELRGRGANRNASFSGTLPWHRSLRDVNLNTGNLFKSFADVQVSPARGAGLAWQRTYNSNDERVGPFGVGWTHAYDIRINEAGNNEVPRKDFFGGEHVYHRDADGLYSPPAYMFDELSSNYDNFLADGPPEILSDDQKGMDGTVKHFMSGGTDADSTPSDERVIEYIEDRHGNRTVFTYGLTATFADGSTKKLLTAVTDPSGRSLEVSWQNLGTTMSPAWRITQVAGPFDSSSNPVYTVTYEYNNDLNLWKVHQDPSGLNRVTTFTYTTVSGESGLLASVADPLGHTVSYTYSLPQQNFTGTVWVTGISEPGSGGTLNWTISPQIPGQQPWPFSCNVTNNGGQSLHLVMHDRLTTAFMQANNYYLYVKEYDAAYNVTSIHRGGFIWGPDHYYTSIPSSTQLMTYGPHGNVLTQSTQGISNSTTTTSYYNASKYFQKESVTDPNGNVTAFDYFDNADTNVGNRGEAKWVRDARYSVTGQQFEYAYNQYGQKQTETNLSDVVTGYTYGDTWGNLTQVVQDPGTGHLNRTTQMTYDAAGRVVSSTDPKSQISSFAYNAVGQPTQASLPGESVSYSYGANGRTESVTDGRGATTMAYETGNDRIASVTDPVTGAISYTYGLAGERTAVALPGGGTWSYDYDNGGLVGGRQQILPKDDPNSLGFMLRNIEDDQGRVVSYYSDQYGGLHQVRNNRQHDMNGTLVGYMDSCYTFESVNGVGRGVLSQIKNTWNQLDPMLGWQSQVLVQNDYTYDNNGNRLTNTVSDISGPIRTEQYGYDAVSRLTSVNYGDGQTQTYAFDPMGNRTQKADSVTGTESYTYNNANMLLTRGSNSYTNDLNGNTLTGGGRTNTWDGQNRLTQCVTGTDTSTFVYGADGLRRQSTVNSTTTDFIMDGSNVVRERQGSTNLATYLHGVRGTEYRRNDSTGAVRWYLYDGLGSVLGEVDGSGNITASRKYDVYGKVRATVGTSTSTHKFVGSLGHPSEDGTGLIYMRARYYDPLTGGFASEDPARDGANWFAYAAGAPSRLVDPDGKSAVDQVVLGLLAFETLKWAWVLRLSDSITGAAFKSVISGASAMIGSLMADKSISFGLTASVVALALATMSNSRLGSGSTTGIAGGAVAFAMIYNDTLYLMALSIGLDA